MFIVPLHVQSVVYINPQNREISKAVWITPSLPRRKRRREALQQLF